MSLCFALRRGLALLAAAVVVPSIASGIVISGPQYQLVDLAPGNSDPAHAVGINSAGHVFVTATAPGNSTYTYIYNNGAHISVSGPTAYNFYGEGINDSDVVIGWYLPTQSTAQPVSYINNHGQLTLLPAFAEYSKNVPGDNYATSINSSGDVAGYATSSTGWEHAYIFHNGTMSDIGAEIAYESHINDSGTVAGNRYINGFGYLPYIYNGSVNTFGSFNELVADINEQNQVVGSNSATLSSDGFFFDGQTTWDISTLGGPRTDPTALNNFGQVVGYSDTADNVEHAFLYTVGGGLFDLNNQVVNLPQGLVLGEAIGINDLGQIAVNGGSHPYLLIPVPEPGLVLPVLICAALTSCRHRGERKSRRK